MKSAYICNDMQVYVYTIEYTKRGNHYTHIIAYVCVYLSVSYISPSRAHIRLHVNINTRHEMLASST